MTQADKDAHGGARLGAVAIECLIEAAGNDASDDRAKQALRGIKALSAELGDPTAALNHESAAE